MADDEALERITILLQAKDRDFQRAMDRNNKIIAQFAKKAGGSVSDAAKSIDTNLQKIITTVGTFGRSFAGGLVAGIGIETIRSAVSTVQQLSQEVAEVGNQARRAGVSAEEFQQWAYVAQQNRIQIDAFVDGLKELSLRADEFAVTGKGSAAEAFQRLGYSAEEVAEKMKNPSAMLMEIFGRLEQLDKAAQIRIADELFGGTGGERFVELLDQGAAKIGETKARAAELGLVMSDELIAKAEMLNTEFNTVAATVGVALKSAIISAAASLSDFIDGFRAFQSQRETTLQQRQSDIMRNRVELTSRLDSTVLDRDRQKILDRLRKESEEEDAIIAELSKRNDGATWKPKADGWTAPTGSGAPVSSSGSAGGKSSGRASSVKSAADMIAEIEQETAALDAEARALADAAGAGILYGDAAYYAAVKAKLLTVMQQEGIEVTPDLAEKIDAVARAYAASADSAEDARDKIDRMKEAAERGEGAMENLFGSVLDGADAAKSAVIDLLAEIAKVQFSKGAMGLLGMTSWGGSLISMIGSGLSANARGGVYSGAGISAYSGSVVSSPTLFPFAKGVGLMGEAGPEAILPLSRGSDGKLGVKASGGHASSVSVTIGFDDSAGGFTAYVRDQAGQVIASASPSIVSQSVQATSRASRKSKSVLGL